MFPASEPYQTEMLPVAAPHVLSIKQYGNPLGKPVLFVHGGPGGGTSGRDAQFFDPKLWRVVLFDQRGSGDSTPPSCLIDNTTQVRPPEPL